MPRLIVACLVVALVAVSTLPAGAETFVDLYLGAAVTQDSNLDVTTSSGATSGQEIAWRSTTVVGARAGYWFTNLQWLGPRLDLGVAVDASVFAPAGDTTIIPVSALVLLRTTLLKDEDFPRGRLEPYLGAGPGIFISNVDGSIGNQNNISDTSVDLGVDIRAGAAYRITETISAFAEYRFTHVRPEFSLESGGLTTTSKASFNTHHFVGGIGFRF